MAFISSGYNPAKPMEGRISDDSPFGKALYGHGKGDTVQVEAPAGTQKFKITGIE